MEAARAKGCTEVMAKGQFANTLPKLLASIAAGSLCRLTQGLTAGPSPAYWGMVRRWLTSSRTRRS